MDKLYKLKVIFSFFTKKQLRSRRTKFFLASSFIPLAIFLVIKFIESINNLSPLSGPIFFSRAGMSFFFQIFIQFISLFFGTAVIADEKDRKTLIYLITSPISRPSLLIGKYLSYIFISFLIFSAGISSLFFATYWKYLFTSIFAGRLLLLNLSGLISIMAYGSLFLLLGTLLKKSTIIGVIFIFGWEYIAVFIPGAAQRLTLLYYIRAITPVRIRMGSGPFASVAEPVSSVEALIILIFATIIFTVISTVIFKKKEYVLTGNI